MTTATIPVTVKPINGRKYHYAVIARNVLQKTKKHYQLPAGVKAPAQ